MLIHLDASAIADATSASRASARSLACIENLLLACHDGAHVVSVSRADSATLSTITGRLSERAMAALKRIQGSRAEIEGLRKELAWYLELGIGASFDGKAHVRGGQRVILANLHHFDLIERAGCSILLGENLTDAELYGALGQAFVAHKGWRVQFACEKRGAGGNTIAKEFAQVVTRGRILLAIADSDRSCPDESPGDTAKKLLKEVDKKQPPAFQSAFILWVRAAENLLPSMLYEEALAPHATTPSIPERLQVLERRLPASQMPWRAHANLKLGIRLVEVQQMPAGTAAELFWSNVSQAAGRDRCAHPVRCKREGECSCYVVEALGLKALDKTVDWLRAQKPKRIANLLDFANNPRLIELCEQVIAWSVAPANRPN